MTPTDLRVSYKRDTGRYPLTEIYKASYYKYKKDKYILKEKKKIGGTIDYRGYPTNLYATWLEEKIGNVNDLKNKFYSIYKECPSNQFPIYDTDTHEIYSNDYIYWLEDLFLKNN